MGSQLPTLKGREVVRVLEHAGFVLRRSQGDHLVFKRPSGGRNVIVPNHPGADVKEGTLRGIIESTGMSTEEFLAYR